MKKKDDKIDIILKSIFKRLFKEDKKFYSMDNTSRWDSLNHLRLIEEIQAKLKVKFSNSEISKITDEQKIKSLLKKKFNY